MPRLIGPGFLTVLTVAALLASGGQALASHVQCGDVITLDTTLDSDLVDCPGDGIVIGASGVALELGGHVIDGGGIGVGIDANGFSDIRLRNGTVREFDEGIALAQAASARLTNLAVRSNASGGIALTDSDRNLISRTSVSGNGAGNPFLEGKGISLVDGSDGNRVAGNDVSDDVALFGSYQNAFEGNRVSAMVAVADGRGNRVERNWLGSGIAVDGADENVVSRNVVQGGIGITSADRNLVTHNFLAGAGICACDGPSQNRITDNLVWAAGGAGIALSEGAHENEVTRNRVWASGTGIEIAEGSRNRVQRNSLVENGAGMEVSYTARDNWIQRNRVSANRHGGIISADAFDRNTLAGTRFEENRVFRNGGDGIFVADNADYPSLPVLVRGNLVVGNEDDGIDAEGTPLTIQGNRAYRNGDLGIEALTGVTDAGGNRAFGNGNPLQCLNVVCR